MLGVIAIGRRGIRTRVITIAAVMLLVNCAPVTARAKRHATSVIINCAAALFARLAILNIFHGILKFAIFVTHDSAPVQLIPSEASLFLLPVAAIDSAARGLLRAGDFTPV